MATMRYTDIDRDFPVAGQDNESQGFRDNFDAIQESLEYANTEIDTLKETTVRLDQENTFSINSNIKDVKFVGTSEEVYKSDSAIILSQDLSYSLGSYQKLIIGDNVTLTLRDWPALLGNDVEGGRYARMRIEMVSSGDSTSVRPTFDAEGTATILHDESWPADLVLTSSTEPVVVEFWTTDSSGTIYAKYLGQYGATAPVSTVKNLDVRGSATVVGNTTLGTNSGNTVTFNAVPRMPRLTESERNGLLPASPTSAQKLANVGIVIYNTTANKFQGYQNSGGSIFEWVDLS